MNIEKIDEPIRVLAVFSGGAIEPLRFRWGRRTYNIDRVNGRWTDRAEDPSPATGTSGYSLHYSVQVGQETYYIHFSSVEVPRSEAAGETDRFVLFDSKRDYLSQMDAYNAWRDGDESNGAGEPRLHRFAKSLSAALLRLR